MELLHEAIPPSGRTCGSCTACCKAPPIESTELSKEAGVWCTHCDKGRGCKIYHNRPTECQDFLCEWMKGWGKETERPDRVRVILDYVVHKKGLSGGVLQIWELVENALLNKFTKNTTQTVLVDGIWVLHIPLGGTKGVLFVPPGRKVPEDYREIENITLRHFTDL